jgi:two-component system cell cycle response regulator DivK
MTMSSPLPSVLIVDSSAENREVLRTVLARRGLRIFEADEAARGLELAREHHPDVIVLDVEAAPADGGAAEDQFGVEATEQRSSLVILGVARRQAGAAAARVVAKPYHFAPLVHTIELLAAKAA